MKTTYTQALRPNFLRQHQQAPTETMFLRAAEQPHAQRKRFSRWMSSFPLSHGAWYSFSMPPSTLTETPLPCWDWPSTRMTSSPSRGSQSLFFLPNLRSSGTQDPWVLCWYIYKNELAKHGLFPALKLLWGREREQYACSSGTFSRIYFKFQ